MKNLVSQIYDLKTANGAKKSLVKIVESFDKTENSDSGLKITKHEILNIFMIDSSVSMSDDWAILANNWHILIDCLKGENIRIIAFSDTLKEYEGKYLKDSHFIGSGTNITLALQKIQEIIETAAEKYMRIFLITDGEHNAKNTISPQEQIDKMHIPDGKSISTYVLGIRNEFPVNDSLSIRSKIHNGNPNIPTLFWARVETEISPVDQPFEYFNEQEKQMHQKIPAEFRKIAHEISNEHIINAKLLNSPGALKMPNISEQITEVYINQWLYFDSPSTEIGQLKIQFDDSNQEIELKKIDKMLTADIFVDEIVPIWNSMIIQLHRNKEVVPIENFGLMAEMFEYLLNNRNETDCNMSKIKKRMLQLENCQIERKFKLKISDTRSILNIADGFIDEVTLAEKILNSAVKTSKKFSKKIDLLMGYNHSKFDQDKKIFFTRYRDLKEKILALEEPSMDESCSVTYDSFFENLQDPDFEKLENLPKAKILSIMSMTGVGAFAPMRDASQINVWTMRIVNVLESPYKFISQSVLETGNAEKVLDDSINEHYNKKIQSKEIYIEANDPSAKFNIVIPVFPKRLLQVIKPLIDTNFFELIVTFCIMKNPNIISHDCHLAALSVLWIKILIDKPKEERSSYIKERIELVDATASIYIEKPRIVEFIRYLKSEPHKVLMSESDFRFKGKPFLCHSIIMPIFYMHLSKTDFSIDQFNLAFKICLIEFTGRCISKFSIKRFIEKSNDSDQNKLNVLLSDLFLSSNENKKIKKWITGSINAEKLNQEFKNQYNDKLLDNFLTLAGLRKSLAIFQKNKRSSAKKYLHDNIVVTINAKNFDRLHDYSSAGDLKLGDLKKFAIEHNIDTKIFSDENLLKFTRHALKYPDSKLRMQNVNNFHDEPKAVDILKINLVYEIFNATVNDAFENSTIQIIDEWKSLYFATHSDLVLPMTKSQIIEKAPQMINEQLRKSPENFDKIYKYNQKTMLLRNACMHHACPHFLIPNPQFNEHLHLKAEYNTENFAHSLHLSVKLALDENTQIIVDNIYAGKFSGNHFRSKPSPHMKRNFNQNVEIIKKIYEQNRI